MYHKVDLRAPTMWWVDVERFHDQMLALRSRRVVYLDDYDPGDRGQVVITFDGVYRNVLQFAAPILRRLGYPFELFLSSDHIGRGNSFDAGEPPADFANEDELRQLVRQGGRLQWHTRSHQLLEQARGGEDWGEVERELSVPAAVVNLDPSGFRWFAYPHGRFSPAVLDEVRKHFAGAVSCHQGNDHDLHRLNRITVTNETRMREKTICVVIVSYNYGAFLAEAVESVLQQTYLPDSVLIMDDASEDATPEVGRKYAALHPELVSFLRNEQNLGIVDTFNRAVERTRSDYICFLGADNRLPSNYLERAIAVLDRDPQVAVAYTDFMLFGARAQEEYLRHDALRRGRIVDGTYYEIVFPEFSKAAFLEGSFMHGSSVYRREAFERVGGYRAQGNRPEDANLFRRMIRAGYSAGKVPGTWLEYRQHSDEQANVISRAQGELQFYRYYTRRLELKVKLLERAFGPLAPVLRALGWLENACFQAALRVAKAWRRLF